MSCLVAGTEPSRGRRLCAGLRDSVPTASACVRPTTPLCGGCATLRAVSNGPSASLRGPLAPRTRETLHRTRSCGRRRSAAQVTLLE
ncbi:hypothetical protein PsYK624_101430 [Phanerochaete sordida]|uniref:Uncharacterized protein n=1 Tax=Phanerochaete sordida TaxID=48140 RepID=A0A9P3GFS5_9APHY|nr:hypothetical protein PsYK624_101430 [Phanerochaete sordida]